MPLTYEFSTMRNGVPEFTYIENRSSDGSTRTERGDGADIKVSNAGLAKYYHFHNGEWIAYPARPQPNNGKPYLRFKRDSVTAVSPDDSRVQGVALSAGIPLTFYEWRPGGGKVSIYCPELNMLEVWTRTESDRSVFEKRVLRVTLGEPSVSFELPAGVWATERFEAAGPGIVEGGTDAILNRPRE
jgi:hypothetical protein